MKTKNNVITLLALCLSLITTTAFGQVSVTANSFSYNSQICFSSQNLKVMDLNIENLYTGSADSVDLQDMSFYANGYPFTLADSLFIFKNGKQIGSGKFSSGTLNINLSRWLKPATSIDLVVYCKTLNVSQHTQMTIQINHFQYSFRSSWNGIWPNIQSPWFNTYDCTQPIVSDNNSVNYNGVACYDRIGDTISIFGVNIKNPNTDSVIIDGFRMYVDNSQWNAQIDSIFVYQNGVNISSASVPYNTSGNSILLLFSKKILGSKNVDLRIICKLSSRGSLPYVEIDSLFWTFQKKKKVSDLWVGGYWNVYLQDCKPRVYLQKNTPYKSNTVCSKDSVSVYAWIDYSKFELVKHEYFVNGKLLKKFNYYSDSTIQIPLHVGKTTVTVKITDITGRIAVDSTIFTVNQSPTPKMSVSSTSMCAGDYVTFTADTIGIAKWSWEWEMPSSTTKTKITVFEGGRHAFTAVAKNGCSSDTSVLIYKVPSQNKPSIVANDWVLGSSVKADSFSWSKYNDTSKIWVTISNSNKMFINRTDKGFYMVKAWNSGGCFAESDMVFHSGYTVKDSLPHVKLLFTASKPGTKFCSNEKIIATRKILETLYPVTKEEWFLNGSKIPFTKNQLFDGMEYTVPMSTSSVKVKVVVTDNIGKTAVDSFVLTVNKSPKAIITSSSNKMCSGSGVTITADTTGLSKWAWGTDKPSKYANKLTVYEGGGYMFTAIASNECSSDTTVMLTKIPAQFKPTGLSNDWTIGSSVNASSFVWYRLNDTTNKLQVISNSNKMFMKETRKGYYAVEAFNSYGCSQISDNFFHSGWVIKDSMPYVKLIYLSSNTGLKFCPDDKLMVTRKILEPVFPIVKEEWFWNGKKIPFTKNQLFDGMEYRVSLNASVVTLKVVVTDKVGKTATDSIVVTVNKSPKALIKLSSSTFCSGNNVTLIADTTGVTKYAWNNDKLSVYPTKLSISESGSYKFTVASKEGCLADTTVIVTRFQTPNRPTGLSNDWTIGSSESADSFVWFKYNDTTSKFEIIKNSNKMFLRELRKGYYKVETFSKNGCSSVSETFFHKGYLIMDSMPHVKLRITASKPGIKFCSSEKIVAGRQILETAFPVVKEEWFLNGSKIPFTKNQLFDAMEYVVPMSTGAVSLKVVVTDKVGKTAVDSFEFTVMPKPKITLDHPSTKTCYGGTVNICIDTTKLEKWSFNGVPSKNPKNNFQVFESSLQLISITSIYGCNADTSFTVVMYPKQERLVINSTDSLLWVNQNAYGIEWFYESISIGFGNQIIKSKKSGFYQAIAANQFGCTASSDLYLFKYVAPKEPVVPKDTISVIIGAKNPSHVFCEGEFNPTLTLVNFGKESVLNTEWFVNGKSVFSCKNVQLCGLVPKYIWLTSGTQTIIVRVTLLNNTIEADTAYVTVVGPMKTKLSINGPSAECVGRTVRLSLQDSMNYKSVTWSTGSISKALALSNPNGSFFATTTDYNGCFANTDTVLLQTLVLPKPSLAISGCTLFADIDWQQKGSWQWTYSNKTITTTEPEITVPSGKVWWKVRFSYGGCSSEYSSAVFVECNFASAHNLEMGNVKVYPNPFIDQLMIDAEAGSRIVFIDVLGKILYEKNLEKDHEEIRPDIPAGIYIVLVSKDDKVNRFKILKQ